MTWGENQRRENFTSWLTKIRNVSFTSEVNSTKTFFPSPTNYSIKHTTAMMPFFQTKAAPQSTSPLPLSLLDCGSPALLLLWLSTSPRTMMPRQQSPEEGWRGPQMSVPPPTHLPHSALTSVDRRRRGGRVWRVGIGCGGNGGVVGRDVKGN